jgi:hypothetical protein
MSDKYKSALQKKGEQTSIVVSMASSIRNSQLHQVGH